jgi:hypothetical protein
MASLTWAIGTPTITRLAARSRSGQDATSVRPMHASGAVLPVPVDVEVDRGAVEGETDARASWICPTREVPNVTSATVAVSGRNRDDGGRDIVHRH